MTSAAGGLEKGNSCTIKLFQHGRIFGRNRCHDEMRASRHRLLEENALNLKPGQHALHMFAYTNSQVNINEAESDFHIYRLPLQQSP